MVLLRTFFAVGAICFGTHSVAQSENRIFISRETALGLIRHSTIQLIDEVEGNCWTNASTVKAKVQLLFEQSDIVVSKEDLAFFDGISVKTRVHAFGGRRGETCIVGANISAVASVSHVWGRTTDTSYYVGYTANIFERYAIYMSTRNVNEQLSGFFEGAVAQFAAQVIAGRRDQKVKALFEEFPNLLKDPMTEKHWRDLIAEHKK